MQVSFRSNLNMEPRVGLMVDFDVVVADFLNQTISFMDTLDWIERYAWFGYFVSL